MSKKLVILQFFLSTTLSVTVALAQSATAPVLQAGAASGGRPPAPPLPETVTVKAVTANVTVEDQQLHDANGDQDDWLLYGRTYDNQRFSPLTAINSANVKSLKPIAVVQTGIANSFEDTPIVVNGIMYVVTPLDHVIAYDAVTGEPLWRYDPELAYSRYCCGPEARGVAVAYGNVYVARLDATIVALDARTGKVVWHSDPAATLPGKVAENEELAYAFSSAPQVYDGMVVIGTSGGEFPIRGFIQAYDAQTGKLIWRFRTTAAPGEPGGETWGGDAWKVGGGPVWNTPAYDPIKGIISFAVGNPNPDINGAVRPGDNAYTDSIVALNAKDGKLKWWYQEVPHDVKDWDSAGSVMFLNVADAKGRSVPAAVEANKQGYLYFVNRDTGAFIRRSDPLGLQSANMNDPLSTEPVPRYPSASGGAEWSPLSYSPLTQDIYVNAANVPWSQTLQSNTNGLPANGRMSIILNGKELGSIDPSGRLSAVDVRTGKIVWKYESTFPMIGGTLATAGNLVFAGEMDGYFDAFDAKTGDKLWHFNLGAGVNGSPVTYRVNGVQYVAVPAGGNAGNSDTRIAQMRGYAPVGDVVAIFALDK